MNIEKRKDGSLICHYCDGLLSVDNSFDIDNIVYSCKNEKCDHDEYYSHCDCCHMIVPGYIIDEKWVVSGMSTYEKQKGFFFACDSFDGDGCYCDFCCTYMDYDVLENMPPDYDKIFNDFRLCPDCINKYKFNSHELTIKYIVKSICYLVKEEKSLSYIKNQIIEISENVKEYGEHCLNDFFDYDFYYIFLRSYIDLLSIEKGFFYDIDSKKCKYIDIDICKLNNKKEKMICFLKEIYYNLFYYNSKIDLFYDFLDDNKKKSVVENVNLKITNISEAINKIKSPNSFGIIDLTIDFIYLFLFVFKENYIKKNFSVSKKQVLIFLAKILYKKVIKKELLV